MKMFDDDLSIYGEYARIIKKYTKTADGDADVWLLENGEDAHKSSKIFGTYIDCLYCGAALGLAKKHKIKEKTASLDKKMRANILASAWKSRQRDFNYLYILMILTDPDLSITKDERVKKAFSDVPDAIADTEMEFFLSYAYGGLLELDRMLSDVSSYTDLANKVLQICVDYKDPDDE